MKRTCKALLNKICPENIDVIAQRVKNECEVTSSEELGQVIGLIFTKALAEPHYCETYADLVTHLKGQMPHFPNPNGDKPITFKSTLLNVCQQEFEAMPKTIEPTPEEVEMLKEGKLDEAEIKDKQATKKKQFLANMKFIGNLYLRSLITAKIIQSIITDLMMVEGDSAGGMPEEHVVECVCELLSTIGHTLEEDPRGQQAIVQVCGKMKEVMNMKKKDGKTGVLSKRIQFQIQDLLDMRHKGWVKKIFKSTAKTKEEIRLERDAAEKSSKPGEVAVAEYVVAGVRKAPVEGGGAASNGTHGKTDAAWQDVKKPGTRGGR